MKSQNIVLDSSIAAGLLVALIVVYVIDAASKPSGADDSNTPKATYKVVDPSSDGKPGVAPKPVPRKPLRLAVSTFQFDDLGALLRKLGEGYKNFDNLAHTDLQDANRLREYDIIFLTCAATNPQDLKLTSALRAFVEQKGGTLYASDLRFDGLRGAFPEFINASGVRPGAPGQMVKARILDKGLQEALAQESFRLTDKALASLLADGVPQAVLAKLDPLKEKTFEGREPFLKEIGELLGNEDLQRFQHAFRNRALAKKGPPVSELTLLFESPGWRPAAFHEDKVQFYMRGDYLSDLGAKVANAPLLAKFSVGKGTVIFTSFHNSRQGEAAERLLEYLVFRAVTAKAEAEMSGKLEQGGLVTTDSKVITLSPPLVSLISASRENPKATGEFHNKKAGKLRFALVFNPEGNLKMRLTVKTPDGTIARHEAAEGFIIEIPDARPGGTWAYTVEALNLPHANFPVTLNLAEPK